MKVLLFESTFGLAVRVSYHVCGMIFFFFFGQGGDNERQNPGVPILAQWVKNSMLSLWEWGFDPWPRSGLRIRCGCGCGVGHRRSSDSTPGLGTSICPDAAIKKRYIHIHTYTYIYIRTHKHQKVSNKKKGFLNYTCWDLKFFNYFFFKIIVDLRYCANFCCAAKWLSYTYTYMFFLKYSFPSWSIQVDWI